MKPTRVALLVSGAYLVPSLLYIFFSSRITADVAASPEAAATIEIIKGAVFVMVSAALVFGVCWKTLELAEKRRVELKGFRETLLAAERRAIAGLLARTAAHDARNVLTVLKSNNDLMRRRDDYDALTEEILDDQAQAIDRIVEMTDRLSEAGRHKIDAKLQPLDLVAVVKDACQALQTHSRLRNRQLEFHTDVESATVKGFPPLIYQILVNLLFNAAEATQAQGRIEVHIEALKEGFALSVHDDGPGVPRGERERIFDAFYSTKDEGAGLGLLAVKTSAVAHGGDVMLGDSPLGGACIRVEFGEHFEDPYQSIDGPLLFKLRAKSSNESREMPVGQDY